MAAKPPNAIYIARKRRWLNAPISQAYCCRWGSSLMRRSLAQGGRRSQPYPLGCVTTSTTSAGFGAVMTTEVEAGQVAWPGAAVLFRVLFDPIRQKEVTITRSSVTNVKDIEKGTDDGRESTSFPYGLLPVLATGFCVGQPCRQCDQRPQSLAARGISTCCSRAP